MTRVFKIKQQPQVGRPNKETTQERTARIRGITKMEDEERKGNRARMGKGDPTLNEDLKKMNIENYDQ